MTETQASRLLPALFEHVDDESPLKVLNLGPILPETVDFFSAYRCKLHFADLYPELPLRVEEVEEDGAGGEGGRGEGQESSLDRHLEEALVLPAGVLFDTVFFWDVLNFMNSEVIGALMDKLRPHLHAGSRAHCFAVHNSRTPVAEHYQGIVDAEHFSLHARTSAPPGYQPHPQGELESLLRFFQIDRSVLMSDRRIELLLKARL